MDGTVTLLEGISSTLAARSELISRGWSERRSGSMLSLEKSTQGSVAHLLDEVREYANRFSSVLALGTFGEMSISVKDAVDSPFVADKSTGDIGHTFEGAQREVAAEAWGGNPQAALDLAGDWRVSLSRDLADQLRTEDPTIAWHVISSATELEVQLQRVAPWRLRPLLDGPTPSVYLVENLDPDTWIVGGQFAITGLQSDSVDRALASLNRSKTSTFGPLRELPDVPAPEALSHEKAGSFVLDNVSTRIWQACAALSWASLATSLTIALDGSLQVEVFGLQRVKHEITSSGLVLSTEECRRAYAIYAWVRSSPGIDKLLAVQQVASLYRDVPPWDRNSDVFEAAQAVFNELQRGSVAEVMQARRSARSMALDITNRTADAASAMTRATAERCVATLLAVLGVVVAQTTGLISIEVAHSLRLLLAGALAGLILWNVFLEGPPLSASLRALETDMPKIADMVSDSDRTEILGLASVSSAKVSVVRTRVAVPLVYAVVAVLALIVHV